MFITFKILNILHINFSHSFFIRKLKLFHSSKSPSFDYLKKNIYLYIKEQSEIFCTLKHLLPIIKI